MEYKTQTAILTAASSRNYVNKLTPTSLKSKLST
jgi:hypothetical protein